MTDAYLVALALTLACELPLAVVTARRVTALRVARDALLLNLVTHPLAVLGHRALSEPGAGFGLPFVAVEVAVFVAEALGYRWATRLSWRRAAAVAGVCNAITAGLSFLL